MNDVEKFCGQKNGYSRSITLRNRLIPIGKTEENIQKLKLLDKDMERARAYEEVKELIDDYHRMFIEEKLSDLSINWSPLYNKFDQFHTENDRQKKNEIKEQLRKLQSEIRNEISECFKNDKRYKNLFNKKILRTLIPDMLKNEQIETLNDKLAALDAFKNFGTYFKGFYENRKIMYSKNAYSRTISNRIVNENFPIFYSNVKVFEYLSRNYPEIISNTEKSLSGFLNGKKLADFFSLEGFNTVLNQRGIDFYNNLICGMLDESGSKKIYGLNEQIYLARQYLSHEKKKKIKIKMMVLYKQILSERSKISFIPAGFEKSEEVYESVKRYKEENLDKTITDIKELFDSSDLNLRQIYVPAKAVSEFSLKIFGDDSIIHEGLLLMVHDISKRDIIKSDWSLFDIQKAYERMIKETDKKEEKNVRFFFQFSEFRSEGEQTINILDKLGVSFSEINFENKVDLIQDKTSATSIKDFLDEVRYLYYYLKLVDYRGEEQKDADFYSKYNEILQKISEIIPLYNKVHDFVTKKPNEVRKVKLNFNCSSFLSGWNVDYGPRKAHIFIDSEQYYLGIVNNRLKKEDIDLLRINGSHMIQKVVCESKRADFKQFPRLFIRSKGDRFAPVVRKYNVPVNEILDIYDKKLFKTEYRKKNPEVYKESLCKMIDYYKSVIPLHDSYKSLNFSWKDSKEYNDISEFYNDIEKSIYQIKFEAVNYESLLSLVESGKIFLFQIYNKDFSIGTNGRNGSTGKKNLHTLYWENLFKEENLCNTCIKLEGKAEIFWREANPNLKVVSHKKGSILVNRTTSDGKNIPEELYLEIYKYKNPEKPEKDFILSKEAKELLKSGTVVYKKAKFDITKDKHFTQQTYLFHCPINLNFKAPEITGIKFNKYVQEVLKNNPDVKIIGLDRGERNLIYLSLINQKGEIELQKSLNLVEQVRKGKTVSVNYQEKLVQKETERKNARKNWQTISKIKELKEGYLSNIVHEIAQLMVKNNAIVVMEDLSVPFKRGRFAVERQVYQKFENMLIDKLSYLVFKDRKTTEPGGVLNAYQLANKVVNKSNVGKQCGWIFYIPANYTSKIEPKKGFVNLFRTTSYIKTEKKKDFFDKFDSIRYDRKLDCFVFSFDYSNFSDNAAWKKKWDVYSRGERLVFSKKEGTTISVNPTENLKVLFDKQGIHWDSEDNFIDQIQAMQAERDNVPFYEGLYRSFITILQMRNTIPNSLNEEDDYLISPVMADDGTFYDSRDEAAKGKDENGKWISKLPVCADANGAYHIALKGLYLLKNDFNLNEKGYIKNISNAEWFKFAQNKEYAK